MLLSYTFVTYITWLSSYNFILLLIINVLCGWFFSYNLQYTLSCSFPSCAAMMIIMIIIELFIRGKNVYEHCSLDKHGNIVEIQTWGTTGCTCSDLYCTITVLPMHIESHIFGWYSLIRKT